MPTTVDDVVSMTKMVEIEPKNGSDPKTKKEEKGNETAELDNNKSTNDAGKEKIGAAEEGGQKDKEPKSEEKKEEEVPVEVEPKSGVSFTIRLSDGKQLQVVGLRKKSMLGMGIKVYAFGMILKSFFSIPYRDKHISIVAGRKLLIHPKIKRKRKKEIIRTDDHTNTT